MVFSARGAHANHLRISIGLGVSASRRYAAIGTSHRISGTVDRHPARLFLVFFRSARMRNEASALGVMCRVLGAVGPLSMAK